jgi:cytochrome c-type biogenesis protein
MDQLFTILTHAVAGTPGVALAAAFVWGILSIILSPCHLASIPLIVGVITEQRVLTTRRAFWTATAFALGILLTIGVIGVVTAALGRMAGDIGGFGNYLVAGIFFLVGLHLLDVISLPFSGPGQVTMPRKGILAAFLLGLLFGIALGPCTFAYMAPILGVTFRVGATAPLYAAGLLLAYGLGHCGVIIAAGTSTEIVQRYLHWNDTSHGMLLLKKACGVLVLFGGLYLIYTAH